jgi:hypothetical protein
MMGGMAQDALGEIEIVNKLAKNLDEPSSPRVKVRCQKCRALNDETNQHCGQCGAAI